MTLSYLAQAQAQLAALRDRQSAACEPAPVQTLEYEFDEITPISRDSPKSLGDELNEFDELTLMPGEPARSLGNEINESTALGLLGETESVSRRTGTLGRPGLTARQVLVTLEASGVQLSVVSGRLHLSASSGALTDEVRAPLVAHRRTLLAWLTKPCVDCGRLLPMGHWVRCPACVARAWQQTYDREPLVRVGESTDG